jgi:hypothetical protein
VDGVTYQMYEKDALRNIQQLYEQLREVSRTVYQNLARPGIFDRRPSKNHSAR